MPIAASGLFYLTFRDALQNDIALDLLADTIKVALFTNAITNPNFDTNTAYNAAPFNANQVGTPAGGITITAPTITIRAGSLLTFDGADTPWASQTFAGARGGLIYDDTIPAKPALVLVNFGADYGVTAGVLTITWAAAGIFFLDLA